MTRLSHIHRTLFPELSPALLAVVLLAAVVARVGIGSIVADDAYITFRYSENIATGQLPSHNRRNHAEQRIRVQSRVS